VMWQIPLGNTKMRALDNTWNHYQDNRVEWLLDDPGRTHLSEYLQAGVVAFLFGRGANGATCACDAANDGVTNPALINGNTGLSLNADDDGGFFRQKAAAYYSAGAMTLPGGSVSPTSTPLPTATRNPTSSPQVGVQVVPRSASRTLDATLSARAPGCQPDNRLHALRFVRLTNAAVEVPLVPPVTVTMPTTMPTTVPLPGLPQALTLTVRRVQPGLPSTAELVVTDSCGEWPTFVGGGADAF